MDRILSGDEQSEHYSDIWQHHDTEGLLKAQLAKTDKEWVKWGQDKCPHVSLQFKRECMACWAIRKGELDRG
jgi:hypothetical protein